MLQHIKRELALPKLWRSPAKDLFRHSGISAMQNGRIQQQDQMADQTGLWLQKP